ncbi:MAG: hypothetical protein OES12_06650, partial [Anaerolineae bacterium]|nr:hypothetical protein [Anaerolineae bacterium]
MAQTVAAKSRRSQKQKTLGKFSARLREYSYTIAAIIVGLVLCEVLVNVADIKAYILPAPSLVFVELFDQAGNIFDHTLVTAWEVILGFTLSVIVGIPIGVGIYYSKFLERIFYPFLVASQTIPKIAIAP